MDADFALTLLHPFGKCHIARKSDRTHEVEEDEDELYSQESGHVEYDELP